MKSSEIKGEQRSKTRVVRKSRHPLKKTPYPGGRKDLTCKKGGGVYCAFRAEDPRHTDVKLGAKAEKNAKEKLHLKWGLPTENGKIGGRPSATEGENFSSTFKSLKVRRDVREKQKESAGSLRIRNRGGQKESDLLILVEPRQDRGHGGGMGEKFPSCLDGQEEE